MPLMSGKVCVVTGASSGIGRATAVGLVRLGAKVIPIMRGQSPQAESSLSEMKAAAQGNGEASVGPSELPGYDRAVLCDIT